MFFSIFSHDIEPWLTVYSKVSWLFLMKSIRVFFSSSTIFSSVESSIPLSSWSMQPINISFFVLSMLHYDSFSCIPIQIINFHLGPINYSCCILNNRNCLGINCFNDVSIIQLEFQNFLQSFDIFGRNIFHDLIL